MDLCQQDEEASDFLFLLGWHADVVVLVDGVAPPANGIEYHFVFRPLGLDKSSARACSFLLRSRPHLSARRMVVERCVGIPLTR